MMVMLDGKCFTNGPASESKVAIRAPYLLFCFDILPGGAIRVSSPGEGAKGATGKSRDFPAGSIVKKQTNKKKTHLPVQETQRHGFNPWVRKSPWRRKWQPTPVFLPGESHGQKTSVEATVFRVTKNRTRLSMHMQERTLFQNAGGPFGHLASHQPRH